MTELASVHGIQRFSPVYSGWRRRWSVDITVTVGGGEYRLHARKPGVVGVPAVPAAARRTGTRRREDVRPDETGAPGVGPGRYSKSRLASNQSAAKSTIGRVSRSFADPTPTVPVRTAAGSRSSNAAPHAGKSSVSTAMSS